MYKTLGPDICKGRHIVPEPASLKKHEEETMGEATDVLVKAWMKDSLKECTPAEATPWTELMTIIQSSFGTVSKHVMTECNIAPKFKGQYRPSKGVSHDYLKVYNAETKKSSPVKYVKKAAFAFE